MESTRFTAPLYTADIGRVEKGRPIRVILREFEYGLKSKNDPNRVRVPAGYCSDGTSVPFILRGFLPVWGKYAQAAIVHDILYSTNAVPRKRADTIFHDAILVLTRDVESDKPDRWGELIALGAFWAVRAFGHSAYLNGSYNYEDLAARALARVKKTKDDGLLPLIINNAADLRADEVMKTVVA